MGLKESDIRAMTRRGSNDGGDDDDHDDSRSQASSHEGNSSTSHSLSSSKTGNRTSRSLEEVVPLLARGETQVVKRLRWLTIIALIVVASICCAAVFIFTRNVERQAFTEEFASSGLKVIQAFQTDSYRKLDALHSLSSTITAYAIDNNLTWPFVTLESSAHVLEPYLSLAGAAAITLLPLVPADQRAQWESYADQEQWWIEHDYLLGLEQNAAKAKAANRQLGHSPAHEEHDAKLQGRSLQAESVKAISPYIKNYVGIELSPGPWFVWWQYVPVIADTYFLNFNRLASKGFAELSKSLFKGFAALSSTFTIVPGLDVQSSRDYFFVNDMLQAGLDGGSYGVGEPLSYIYYPVFRDFESETIVATLESMVYWRSYFEFILPDKVRGIVVVVKNSNNDTFTYQINGKEAVFLGLNDSHASGYDHMMLQADYTSFQDKAVEADTNREYKGVSVDDNHINYWIEVYPSKEMQDIYLTSRPLIYTFAMVFFFALTTSIFLLYDWYVERRQRIVLTSALKSNAVVASMFPKNVRDRLLDNADVGGNNGRKEDFALDEKEGLIANSNRAMPIADFYPNTTVFFCDLVGFTAWSSTREPAQVFALLETVYNAFDEIAKRRRVFKVETVGDCYMAVAGLPDPQPTHALIMARFARDCATKFNQLVRKLETVLGPDTADLNVRTGIHSGPVTGGIIRGERSRFQLFGDSVNVAARMESTGVPGRIQVSQETADLLTSHGKARWLIPRNDEVMAKGKGMLKTFWLTMGDTEGGSSHSRSTGSSDESTEGDGALEEAFSIFQNPAKKAEVDEKTARLISWNVEVLSNLLAEVVAARNVPSGIKADMEQMEQRFEKARTANGMRPIDEVQDIISLPEYDSNVASQQKKGPSAKLDLRVVDQLHSYVQCLAAMYRENAFHNWEHGSHVTMSVSKLLARIIKPDGLEQGSKDTHDHTYGITSCHLVQFSVVLSALIHDVDHSGAPNAQLVKEGDQLANFYKGQSIAEQNSVELAWELLMDENYADLRAAIYSNEEEMTLFRSLVVNTVLATDIVDKDLKSQREARWAKAFSESAADSSSKTDSDRKATIVIEHLIQASDVAHTMQHWHIYRKWNERFFMECYKAYKDGRAEHDPSESWFKGECGFFDYYIIPLAKKLKDCGVFGVSSDEYLSYAIRNRKEWESKGQAIVAEMIQNADKIMGEPKTRRASTKLKASSYQKPMPAKLNSLNTIEEAAVKPAVAASLLEQAPAAVGKEYSPDRLFL